MVLEAKIIKTLAQNMTLHQKKIQKTKKQRSKWNNQNEPNKHLDLQVKKELKININVIYISIT